MILARESINLSLRSRPTA